MDINTLNKVRHYERVPEETPQNSIYASETPGAPIEGIFRTVVFKGEVVNEEVDRYVHTEFRTLMNRLFVEYKPSNHAFWTHLKDPASRQAVQDPEFLSQLYIRYQAAMHATRASVWFTPNLDTPRLRQRKAAIIVDDDTVDGDETHHAMLEKLFVFLGADPIPHETRFGDLDTLKEFLDEDTYAFCAAAWRLYVQSTGAWSIFEVLSDNWQSSLYDSLAPHFSTELKDQVYFEEISFGQIEILHMLETVSLTEDVLHRKPHLLQGTMDDAVEMCEWTLKLWDNFDSLLQTYIDKHSV